MRELPRKLTVDELSDLFEGRTRLVELLAEIDDPLEHANGVIDDAERGGQDRGARCASRDRPATGLSTRSAAEQGEDADPCLLVDLATLNTAYEAKFGFRFVVFVNRRSKADILEVLRERLERSREEELDTGCRELVAIARDRWIRT